jgi:hypothetical protein
VNLVGNESEVTLSLALEDNVSPALAGIEAGYLASLAGLEAATLATSAALSAAWLAPLAGLAQATQEALGWLSTVSAELASLGAVSVAPTISVNDLATPTLRAIRAELAALTGELTVVSTGSTYTTSTATPVSVSAAPTIDRQTVRRVIIPELNRLGYRA